MVMGRNALFRAHPLEIGHYCYDIVPICDGLGAADVGIFIGDRLARMEVAEAVDHIFGLGAVTGGPESFQRKLDGCVSRVNPRHGTLFIVGLKTSGGLNDVQS